MTEYFSQIDPQLERIAKLENSLKELQTQNSNYQNEISKLLGKIENLQIETVKINAEVDKSRGNDIQSLNTRISELSEKLNIINTKIDEPSDLMAKNIFKIPFLGRISKAIFCIAGYEALNI